MSAVGKYATESDLDDLRGADNITEWSDLTDAGTRDTARIQRAFDQTDAQIHAMLRHLYAVPLAVSGDDGVIVGNWSTVLAAYWLYANRGQFDVDPETGKPRNQYQQDYDAVMEEIRLYRGGGQYKLNVSPLRAVSDGPVTLQTPTGRPTGPEVIW